MSVVTSAISELLFVKSAHMAVNIHSLNSTHSRSLNIIKIIGLHFARRWRYSSHCDDCGVEAIADSLVMKFPIKLSY